MTSQSRGKPEACLCIAFEASGMELICTCEPRREKRTARKKHSRDGVLRCDICSPLRCSKETKP